MLREGFSSSSAGAHLGLFLYVSSAGATPLIVSHSLSAPWGGQSRPLPGSRGGGRQPEQAQAQAQARGPGPGPAPPGHR